MKTHYHRLSFQERLIIQSLWVGGYTKTAIANQLHRHKSTVTREINRWARGEGNRYDARLAHWNAEQQYSVKHFKEKLTDNTRLRTYVFDKLALRWSPQQIAGRIRIDHPGDQEMTISHEAIYTFIYRRRKGSLNKRLIKLLTLQRTRRRKTYVSRGVSQTKISDRLSISERPERANDRSQVGHWEGDLMIGAGQGSAIATLVERKTRFTCVIKVGDRKSETVTKAIANRLKELPLSLRRSMTYDNGSEMANHAWLTYTTGTKVYFANPYSSWERGSNENTNGLIRRFFPKSTDFSKVSYRELVDLEHRLNNRPRKVLGYKTPLEAMRKHLRFCNGSSN
jgi:IS30 family transposase